MCPETFLIVGIRTVKMEKISILEVFYLPQVKLLVFFLSSSLLLLTLKPLYSCR